MKLRSRPFTVFLPSALVCALLALTAPQMTWAQSGAASQQQESAEGDRLLNAGIQAYQQGQMQQAARLWEQARAVYSRELGEDHPDTLSSMNNLAATYSDLGQHDKALALNEKTLQLMRAKLGEDHPDTLGSMNNLANTYSALGQHDKALALNEKTLQLRRAKLGENHPDTLASMSNLAETYRTIGQNDKALALNEKTLQLRRAKLGEDHPDTLSSMNNLAATYSDLGQHDKALALKEKTLQLRRAKLGEDHPYTLASMNNLANIYSALGQHDKALALKEKTLQLRPAKLGEDHPDTLVSMNNLANTYSDLGQHDKALVLKEKTLQLRRAKLGENHPDTLVSMNNLAVTYSDLGQHDKALVLKEKTFQLMRAKLGESHPDTLSSMNNLATTYSTLGQHDKALALNEKTFQLRRAKLGEDHPDTLASMNNLAVTYRDLGQPGKALTLIPAIFSGAEKLRTQPGLSTEQRQNIFAKYSDDYQRYALWYANAQRFNEGFKLGDLSKARTLTDSIQAQSALRALPKAEQARLQDSQIQAQTLQAQLGKLAQSSGNTEALLSLQKKIDSHNTAHAKLLAELQGRYPKYARLTTIAPATAEDAKHLLGAGDAFVSYLIHTNGTAQAFVLTQNGPAQWVDLGEINNHAKTVAAYRELMSPSHKNSWQGQLVALKNGGYEWLQPNQAMPKDASQVATNMTQALPILKTYWHQTLIAPVLNRSNLAKMKNWIISPDKDLALLPFDTLPDSATNMLGQTRNMTLVQSFAVYSLLKQREAEYAKLPRTKELFAMGNAVYSNGWAENRGIKRADGERGFGSTERDISASEGKIGEAANTNQTLKPAAEQYALNKFYWKNLPGTAHEIKTISALFAENSKTNSSKVDSYQGLDASEANLQKFNLAGKLQDYRYMLFSAHGYLAQNPALSALVLSQQGNPEGIDGYVSASEWPLYDLKSDLTVLSACDTGVGKTQAGESVMGLPYALFVAGNKNTILTLWPVDDDATAEFMRRFFSKLKAGEKQRDALSQTKQEFMQHAQWNLPKYWAAFVLYGV